MPLVKTALAPAILITLVVTACSKDPPAPAATPPAGTATVETPEENKPHSPSHVNIALADMGGAVEELTGNYGPGFTGRRLVDGLLAPTWRQEQPSQPVEPFFPQEAVISFFEREAAEIEALDFILPADASAAPKDIEIWTSMKSPYENFSRVAVEALQKKSGVQTVEFDAVEAKYLKLKVLSGHSPGAVEIAELRVLESDRRGYTPLFTRAPLAKHWQGSPREGAQRGLDWLQQAGVDWTNAKRCFGCHVQAQVLMGQAVAYKHGYRVNLRAMRVLYDHTRAQNNWGYWWHPSNSATAFGAMGVVHAMEVLGTEDDKKPPYVANGLMGETANHLVRAQREDGAHQVDEVAPPIIQGNFMTTGNTLVALKWAAAHYQNQKYDAAAERGLTWIASHEPETTQDKIFKIISLMHYGTPDQKRQAWSVVETLAGEQQSDGGWKESTATAGSNAIATGQVLYAFKQAGVSIHGPMFRRGVDFLLGHQSKAPELLNNGSWVAMNTASQRPTDFAHTMWAVIGLAGAYGPEPTGALQIVKQQGDKPPARNLVIVLDVSGSMNARLGATTRWKTALGMIEDVVNALPEDLNVGLRVYGHRHSSKSPQTCKDTELVVPIAKLDRAKILKAASNLKPRGETPLIHSSLQAVNDLKSAGGGSVILITDGEESCKGDPKQAAAEIAASGVDVTLNIVGFTLTGEAVKAELGTLAGSTGGRYYSAQDGEELSRAVKLAALSRLPYDILDAKGKVLVSGQTSELSRELPPGKYRIRIDALGQVLEDTLTIAPNETTTLGLGVENDRFVIQR